VSKKESGKRLFARIENPPAPAGGWLNPEPGGSRVKKIAFCSYRKGKTGKREEILHVIPGGKYNRKI
jgi:hypothetical protein